MLKLYHGENKLFYGETIPRSLYYITMSNVKAISWREQVVLWWDNTKVIVLEQHD